MPILAECPECAKKFKLSDTLAGKRVRCPSCQGVIALPAVSSADVTAKEPVAARSTRDEAIAERPKRRRDDDTLDDDRPRRRRPRDTDEDYEEPSRKRRPGDEEDEPRNRRRRDRDEEDEPRNRRRRDRDEEDDERPRRKKGSRRKKSKGSNLPLILGIGGGGIVLVGILVFVLMFTLGGEPEKKQAKNSNMPNKPNIPNKPGGGGQGGGGGNAKAAPRGMNRFLIGNNMKQIGLGIHSYTDVTTKFPPVNDGKLSWRVHILPYINQQGLYNRFDRTKPWDHSTNKELIKSMPKMYRVGGEKEKQGYTHFRRFDGPKIPKTLKFTSFPDGTSNTLMFVEASEPVIWTKPEPLIIREETPLPNLGYANGRDGGFHAVFADGSYRFIRKEVPEEDLRALILPGDGKRGNISR
ncbi:MAG: DUF1559 domain-containing protein [Gemmataceae bacterium]